MATKVVKASLDVGNGYFKTIINGKLPSVYPSVAVKQFNTKNLRKIEEDEIPLFMKDVFNNMDLSFSSPLVSSTERRVFGERALKSSKILEEFDVNSPIGKAEVDLSGALALGAIAADQLQTYYEGVKSLPANDTLNVHVDLATALPIAEHRKNAKMYRAKFLNGGNAHIVTFHNFERPIRVEIIFDYVQVMNEGEAAQYGLMFANDELLDTIYKTTVKRFPELADSSGKEFVSASNTLGLDIGEGTINFTVFTDDNFNQESSFTIDKGYGQVLEETLVIVQSQGYPFNSRKELAEFIQHPPRFSKNKWAKIKSENEEQERRFAENLSSEISRAFRKMGGFIEVIFVFGGGATPLEWVLYDQIKEVISKFGDDDSLPIVYLDNKYSQYLNVYGLYQLALRLRPATDTANV